MKYGYTMSSLFNTTPIFPACTACMYIFVLVGWLRDESYYSLIIKYTYIHTPKPFLLLLDKQTPTANTQHSTLEYTSVLPYWYTPHPHHSLYIFLHQGETGPHAAFLLQQPQIGL